MNPIASDSLISERVTIDRHQSGVQIVRVQTGECDPTFEVMVGQLTPFPGITYYQQAVDIYQIAIGVAQAMSHPDNQEPVPNFDPTPQEAAIERATLRTCFNLRRSER